MPSTDADTATGTSRRPQRQSARMSATKTHDLAAELAKRHPEVYESETTDSQAANSSPNEGEDEESTTSKRKRVSYLCSHSVLYLTLAQ